MRYSSYNIVGGTLRRGFTLIEILVAVAVIAILMSIFFAVGKGVRDTANTTNTQQLMRTSVAILEESQIQTSGLAINHVGNVPFDWWIDKAHNSWGSTGRDVMTELIGGGANDDPDIDNDHERFQDRSIERFVWATYRIQTVRQGLYAGIDEEYLRDKEDIGVDGANNTLDLDGDGVALENGFLELRDSWGTKLIYAAFVDWGDSEDGDDFLPESNKVFFASAGPDGKWGDVQGDPEGVGLTKQQYEESEDNIIFTIDED